MTRITKPHDRAFAVENGNIVYIFPSLQVTAHKNIFFDLPDWLPEQHWKFSSLATGRLHWVFFFAGANLCGAYALYNHLSWFTPLVPFAPQIYLILIYACFFMGLPIVRQLINTVRNACIDYTNGRREQSAKLLSQPSHSAKILEAQQFAQKKLVISRSDICFSSAKDSLEQQFTN